MSRVLIVSKQQLKCNFCTKWFTTSSYFARMQKHSLNICQTCLKQFNFQVVDSQTFEIHHLFLINTGTKAVTNLFQLQQQYQKAMQKFKCTLSEIDQKQTLDYLLASFDKYNNQLSNFYSTILRDAEKVKDRIFEICKNHFKDVFTKWEETAKGIDDQTSKAVRHKNQIINLLQTENSKTIGKKMSDFEFQRVFTEIRQQSQDLKNKDWQYYQKIQEKIIWNNRKCHKCLQNGTFSKKKGTQSIFKMDIQDKQNFHDIPETSTKKITRNQRNQIGSASKQALSKKNNLKALRQRCIQNKVSPEKRTNNQKNILKSMKHLNSRQYLKVANQSFASNRNLTDKVRTCDNQRQSICSARSRKNSQNYIFFEQKKLRPSYQIKQNKDQALLQSNNQLKKQLRKNQSQKSFFPIIKQKKSNIQFDIERQKVHSLLKNKLKFSSYLPIPVEKQEKFVDKQWGDRNMVSAIIQMKQKTILNDDICELVSNNIGKIDFLTYLRSLSWNNSIKLIRMVKLEMQDSDFDIMLYWLNTKASNVHTLVVSNNELTQNSLHGLANFISRAKNQLSPHTINLTQIYLGNNYIKPSEGFKYMKIFKQQGIELHF